MTLGQTIAVIAFYFLFSAAVGAMAPPSEAQARGFYGWLYRFLQRLAANADKAMEARFHGLAAEALPANAGAVALSTESTTTRSAAVVVAAPDSE